MGNSNETKYRKNSALQVANALIFTGKYSAIFFPIFTIYIFSTILMAGVEGSVSGVVNLTGELIALPEKLLNSSGRAYGLQACIFWTSIIYIGLFLKSLYLSNEDKNSKQSDFNKIGASAILSLLAFLALLLILAVWR